MGNFGNSRSILGLDKLFYKSFFPLGFKKELHSTPFINHNKKSYGRRKFAGGVKFLNKNSGMLKLS